VKILFTRFPLESIPDGGAERQVISLATGLADKGHAVSFAGSCDALHTSFRKAKLPVVDLDIGPPPVSKFAIARFMLKKKKMKRDLEATLAGFKKLDVIVMLSLTEKLLLTDVAAKKGITVVWIEHDPVGRWLKKNPWLKLLKKQAAYATTVTVSDLSRDQYLDMDWSPKKTVAIPNGIDDAWFREKANDKEPGNTLHLGYVGRLAEEKGVDLLLRAMADEPHATLDIVGDGPQKHALEKRAHRLGLDHRVRFLGRRKDVAQFYRQIHALVLPSRTLDPFGMVVAEAMAMGVPCLITERCGIASCLQAARDVVVVQPDGVRALLIGIKELRNPEKFTSMKKRVKKTAKQQFSLSTMVDRYETLFTERTVRG
jgi:glycosyltransferase involved in cell wall biosynthesis